MTTFDAARPGRVPVVIYRDHLLRFSEIWVRSQGESLEGFVPPLSVPNC